MHDKPTGAVYESLSLFADQQRKTALWLHCRAALALGYYDFNRNHFPEARVWLSQAAADPLLGDYALYWLGLTEPRSGGSMDTAIDEVAALSQALSQFGYERYRRRRAGSGAADSPDNRADLAASVLEAYPKTESKSPLVLLHAPGRR